MISLPRCQLLFFSSKASSTNTDSAVNFKQRRGKMKSAAAFARRNKLKTLLIISSSSQAELKIWIFEKKNKKNSQVFQNIFVFLMSSEEAWTTQVCANPDDSIPAWFDKMESWIFGKLPYIFGRVSIVYAFALLAACTQHCMDSTSLCSQNHSCFITVFHKASCDVPQHIRTTWSANKSSFPALLFPLLTSLVFLHLHLLSLLI